MRYQVTGISTSVLLLLFQFQPWNYLVHAQVSNNGETDPATISSIPIIDLDPWIKQGDKTKEELDHVVRQVQDACSRVGFFLIKNHGLDPALFERAWDVTEQFFNMPMEEKRRYETNNVTEYPYGFEQTEILTKGKALDVEIDPRTADQQQKQNDAGEDDEQAIADLKETYSLGPKNLASGMPPRRWANNATDNDEFQIVIENYYDEMDNLSMILLKLFALALEQPEAFFEDKMDHHMAALRLVNYYPIKSPKMKNDVIRAGAHTDYGALTILNARDAGLQVYLPEINDETSDDKSPKLSWQDVPLVPGALIINLGDLMQRWTNDKWVSTLHRVVMPSTEALERRFSMAYFVNINGDALVETLDSCRDDSGKSNKYGPILAKDHLMAKVLASMDDDPPNDHSEL